MATVTSEAVRFAGSAAKQEPLGGTAVILKRYRGAARNPQIAITGTVMTGPPSTIPTVAEPWDPSAPGILRLPSGRLIRGRSLKRPLTTGDLPTFAVYLLGQPPPAVPWESRWLRWPDFRLPADRDEVLPALAETWQRAPAERVEIACTGGRGRTGTALACLAVIDGVPRSSAVAFVRAHYDQRAVETFRQRRYVVRWPGPPAGHADE